MPGHRGSWAPSHRTEESVVQLPLALVAAETIEMSPKARTCNPRDSLESNKWGFLRFINCVSEQTLEKHQPTKAVSLALTAGERPLPRKQPWIREQGSKALPKGDSEQPRRLLCWCPVTTSTEKQLLSGHHPLCGCLGTSEEPASDTAARKVSWGSDPSYHRMTGSFDWKGP